ncbi:MAG: M48 family peptidase, partial [Burkholderiales bacterium]|nr:M48 family peptidase [Burkholderiales bacterium]
SGEINAAISPLRTAVKLAPDEPLIRILLAQVLLASAQNSGQTNSSTVSEVVTHLRKALVKERCSATGYRQLATAYGLKGETAQAMLASAYAYQYEGKDKLAKRQAEDAKKLFRPGTTNWLKADDILKLKSSGC